MWLNTNFKNKRGIITLLIVLNNYSLKKFSHRYILFVLITFITSCEDDFDRRQGGSAPEIIEPAVRNELFIPPLIDAHESGTSITLTIEEGITEFYTGNPSSTIGYNGNFLGPTIRVYNGNDIELITVNNTEEATTIHKHGLHVPGDVDGGPQQRIDPGDQRVDLLEIRQEASTNWYHPHLMGTTAEQVHDGLAGLWIIEDANSQALNLPGEYGINDIPLIIQDRFFENNVMSYEAGLGDHKFYGNTIIVNGTVGPYKEVPNGWVRFRILNGSNARFYDLQFDDKREFYVIATEGGFLNAPVPESNFQVWPGERYEILVDFSDSSTIFLTATDPENGRDQPLNIIELRPVENSEAIVSLPQTINNIHSYN
mgnify:FL=1